MDRANSLVTLKGIRLPWRGIPYVCMTSLFVEPGACVLLLGVVANAVLIVVVCVCEPVSVDCVQYLYLWVVKWSLKYCSPTLSIMSFFVVVGASAFSVLMVV